MTIRPVVFAKRMPRRQKASYTLPAGSFFKISAVLVAMTVVLLVTQMGGLAAPKPVIDVDPLTYSKGFLVTGDYVVGGVDLNPQVNVAVNGLSTGTIQIADPALAGGAYIVGAYLYWEVIHPFSATSPPDPAVANPALGVMFRNQTISVESIKATVKPFAGNGATCWGAAGNKANYAVTMLRANVLSKLRKQLDLDGKWTGKYLVNSADLPQGDPGHTVSLRETSGNQAIQSAGATLVLFYRRLNKWDAPSTREPLRKILVYDGLYTAYDNPIPYPDPEAVTMSQRITGFYKSTGGTARITHIVGTGGNNQTERITVQTTSNNAVIFGPPPNSADPFPATSPSSDRSWANPTYNLGTQSPFMPGQNLTINNVNYGEHVTTTVAASNTSPLACRAWAAVIFSAEVADEDHDGLPDGLEDATGQLKDRIDEFPSHDVLLPNLKAMGAGKDQPDLFVELNSMWAQGGTTYGSTTAPYPNTAADCYDQDTKSCTDAMGHHHMPTPADVKRIGDRYAAHNIRVHFDVGDLTAYHARPSVVHSDWVDTYFEVITDRFGQPCSTPTGDCYVVPSAHARGGEMIKEVACDAGDPDCVFPAYPGTVAWKAGLLLNREAPVGDNGEEVNPNLTYDPDPIDPNNPLVNWVDSTQHRTRFDRVRRPFFHYLLAAHTRGTPMSPKPCLVGNVPSDYPPNTTVCAEAPNPLFHTPSGSGGLADLPGRNVLLSLGLWDEFVGRPFTRAATIFHELGHNMHLWHSGLEAVFGNAQTATQVEPNCKPNYMSSMSYLFQVHGLFDQFGAIQLDYSGQALDALTETGLLDGDRPNTPEYQPFWFAPAGSQLATDQDVSPATRFCSGVQFGSNPPASMARVHSETFDGNWEIDWDGDGIIESAAVSQDANFDGTTVGASLSGFNDWGAIRLDQISANGLTGGNDELLFFGSSDDGTLIFFGGSDNYINFGGSDGLVFFGGSDLVSFGGGDGELVTFGGSDETLLQFGGSDFDLISFGGSAELVHFGGSDFINFGGSDFINFGGSDILSFGGSQSPELTYKGAEGSKGAPYDLSACIAGDSGCLVDAEPFTPEYHRVVVSWEATTVGHVHTYLVQRKRTDDPNGSWEDLDDVLTTANFKIDYDELPDKVSFTYRVKAYFDDPPSCVTDPGGYQQHCPKSAWSFVPVSIEAKNELPAPQADSYIAFRNEPLIVPAPGIPAVVGLVYTATGADDSSDSPKSVSSDTAYVGRRVQLVQGVPPGTGTLSLQPNGGFTFTPSPGFVSPPVVTFTYKVNDGFWGNTTIPLNGKDQLGNELFSDPVQVTIQVKRRNQ